MALMAPFERYREPGYPGFPPRGGMTFGEVVSAYNMFGNCAAKRHNHMMFHQETHLPDERCTIKEKVALLGEKHKDPLKSWSCSSRGTLTPRLSTRSRTPSPWMPRRPRSLPGTPRAMTPNGIRPSDSRYFKDTADFGGDHMSGAYEGKLDAYFQRGDRGRYGGSGMDTFAMDTYAADSFAPGAEGADRCRSFGSRNPLPTSTIAHSGALGDFPPPTEPLGRHNGTTSGVGALGPSSFGDGAGAVGTGVPPLRTVQSLSNVTGSGGAFYGGSSAYDGLGGTFPARSQGFSGHHCDSMGRMPSQADARAASFVRLNSFLLRTHVTSLVSALAEDGWLEAWESERFKAQAREDSPAWVQTFFRSYMRFIENDDVPMFVTSLRSQIV